MASLPSKTTAAEAKPGVDYRVAARTPVLKGLVFTFPVRLDKVLKRLERRGSNATCKEISLLMALQRGWVLAYRHRFGKKLETGERYTSKELVALPPETILRPLTRSKTKRRKRRTVQ